jgi:hypothetical protein
MKQILVIRIGEAAFLGPDYVKTNDARFALVATPTQAHSWTHVYAAQECARVIASNEFRGTKVYVERYAVSDAGEVHKLGDQTQ